MTEIFKFHMRTGCFQNNTITQPPLPNTIHFHHTINNDKTEIMRITREGVWVNPDMAADETAKAVLDALDSYIKVLVQNAVEAEREACAKENAELLQALQNLHQRCHWADAPEEMDAAKAAIDKAIRARGET